MISDRVSERHVAEKFRCGIGKNRCGIGKNRCGIGIFSLRAFFDTTSEIISNGLGKGDVVIC
jgi:hypothetical protein